MYQSFCHQNGILWLANCDIIPVQLPATAGSFKVSQIWFYLRLSRTINSVQASRLSTKGVYGLYPTKILLDTQVSSLDLCSGRWIRSGTNRGSICGYICVHDAVCPWRSNKSCFKHSSNVLDSNLPGAYLGQSLLQCNLSAIILKLLHIHPQ